MSTPARPNPFLGHTHSTPRPDAAQERFSSLRPSALLLAQTLWDEADQIRLQADPTAAPAPGLTFETYDPNSRAADREEPFDKAVENRLRVAFLSKKGAKVSEWIEQRAAITAEYQANATKVTDDSDPRPLGRRF
jgi:hypothetical protein